MPSIPLRLRGLREVAVSSRGLLFTSLALKFGGHSGFSAQGVSA